MELMKNKILIAKNKYTGDVVYFEYEPILNQRQNGLAMNSTLKKCAHKLGCDLEDLIIEYHD